MPRFNDQRKLNIYRKGNANVVNNILKRKTKKIEK